MANSISLLFGFFNNLLLLLTLIGRPDPIIILEMISRKRGPSCNSTHQCGPMILPRVRHYDEFQFDNERVQLKRFYHQTSLRGL